MDADGNRYVDLVLSWGPLILGHAHPEVLAAVVEAARRGTTYGAPTELEVRLAERVVATFPSIEMVRFVSSGHRGRHERGAPRAGGHRPAGRSSSSTAAIMATPTRCWPPRARAWPRWVCPIRPG